MKDIDSIGNVFLDDLLRFYSARDLEILQSHAAQKSGAGEYACLSEYAYLRDHRIDLEAIPLTDRQLMAVAMVFYGGVKKRRAAEAMKISNQALGEHIKAALKKIEDCFMTT